MTDNDKDNRHLTDIIGVKYSLKDNPEPMPSPGTIETMFFETIDNDRMVWFLGVLPQA